MGALQRRGVICAAISYPLYTLGLSRTSALVLTSFLNMTFGAWIYCTNSSNLVLYQGGEFLNLQTEPQFQILFD